ncbi:nucleotidyltransferase domain-containing protein [Parabacteroides sp. FAFU027]|uniref:nucleotidyltransferase domain-containing protein n=1 Tax=Parabacteroides sp. FAFU027 TaxID=2922715 RepID=UPI001FB025BF|nr:nucleotidyltransferase domain-containing protein [Parabacteroides sp. FAFU027]
MEFGLSENDIAGIRAVLALHPEVDRAVLYGSRAKGTFKPASDIDLTLQGANLTLTILQIIEGELDDLLLPYKFDISVFFQIENPNLIQHIERVGVVFYQK